jgi:stage V sporulation protein D (sporulation-specific penicillin-binding protein)
MDKAKSHSRFTIKMQKKLVVMFLLVALAFAGLSYQLFSITRDRGERYKKQVLSQQRYDSKDIPYKRGTIYDANGSVLASSEKVYNVILDAVALLDKEEYLEPTLNALRSQFGIDISEVRSYLAEMGEVSRYKVLAKRLSYEEITGFIDLQNEENSLVKGIWFEEEYKRVYPGNTLACDVIGFTTNDYDGQYGLEEYYNDVLSGTPGREYGYLNDDGELERRTIAAEDGNSLITTIDANIQSIVEKYLLKFNEELKDNFHPGNGAENVGCIIMKVDSGEILAMASYPNYDLNDTRNTDALIGMNLLDENGKRVDYVTQENLSTLDTEEMMYLHLDALWKNFCISDTYEPGSVSKPFTVAAAIESGSIVGTESYNCEGVVEIGGKKIKCHNRWGDGYLTVQEGVERSCNIAMIRVGQAMGINNFVKFQHIFNFGLKTNIDLQGEARTDKVIYYENNMGPTELATNTFGQGYNTTMIQTITAFCSLINGGYYYEPHMVSKIVSPTGATVQNIEPRLLKQTISEETSKTIVEFCNTVVTGEHGTGKTARPAGYMIGGKTGTAETLPRGNDEYVVSFMGYAPADDPQIAIYVVVDRPNMPHYQRDDAKFATKIVRNILTEVLPYLGIFMTEELSEKEMQELEALQIEIMTPPEDVQTEGEEGEGPTPEGGGGEGSGEGANPQGGESPAPTPGVEIWKTFPIDPVTGYAVDPNTGDFVDPVTGAVHGSSFEGGTAEGDSQEGGESGGQEEEGAQFPTPQPQP